MNILDPDINISLVNSIDDKITEIADMPGVAENLTEKWTYPSGMPEALTFELKKDGRIIGQAALKSFRWFNRKAELSLFLHPDFHNKKIGTGILISLIEYAFFHLNLHRLEAEVNAYNKKAMHVMEKLGFVNEGCLREARYFDGKYHDIYRFGLLKSEYQKAT